MKNLIILSLASLVVLAGCQLLGSDSERFPKVEVNPSPVSIGQEAEITIRFPGEFIMPHCGGVTYQIEKLDSGIWEYYDSRFQICNGLILPESGFTNFAKIKHTIDEVGVYRFASSFKISQNNAFEKLYSDAFEVVE